MFRDFLKECLLVAIIWVSIWMIGILGMRLIFHVLEKYLLQGGSG